MLVLFVHEMELVLCARFNRVELIDLQPGCSLYLVRSYGFASFGKASAIGARVYKVMPQKNLRNLNVIQRLVGACRTGSEDYGSRFAEQKLPIQALAPGFTDHKYQSLFSSSLPAVITRRSVSIGNSECPTPHGRSTPHRPMELNFGCTELCPADIRNLS